MRGIWKAGGRKRAINNRPTRSALQNIHLAHRPDGLPALWSDRGRDKDCRKGKDLNDVPCRVCECVGSARIGGNRITLAEYNGGRKKMDDLKCLVVYYSRTGYTRKVAEAVAGELRCEAEALAEEKNRRGPIGFLGGVKDAVLKNTSTIEEPARKLSNYDLVVIGTPVWANSVSPAGRALLMQAGKTMPEAAFFLTTRKSGIENTFKQMSELCGREPAARLALTDGQIKKGDWKTRVAEFAENIRRTLAAGSPADGSTKVDGDNPG